MQTGTRKALSILLALALIAGLSALQTGAVLAAGEEAAATYTYDEHEDGMMYILGQPEEFDSSEYFRSDEPGEEMRAVKPFSYSLMAPETYISGDPTQEYLLLEKGTEPDWSLAVKPDEDGLVTFEDVRYATEYVIWTRVFATDEHGAGEPIAIEDATGLSSYSTNGDILIGNTLTVETEPAVEGLKFQWHYDSWTEDVDGWEHHDYTPIEGATGPSYTLTEADLGKYIGFAILKGDTILEKTDNLYGEPVSYGTFVFNTNGGSEIPSLEGLKYGDPITKPEAEPVREGYTFAGWYVDPDSDYEQEYDFDRAVCNYALDSVDAKWIPLEGYALTAESFPEDVDPDAWYYDAVDFVAKKGWMKGNGGGWFGPDDETYRAAAVQYIWNMAGSPETDAELTFEDYEPDFWFAKAVAWAGEQGIVEGYDDGTFGVDDSVTREQFLTMLWRYAKSTGLDVSVGEDTNILSYNDYADVSGYAIPAVQWACGAGLIEGREEGWLNPRDIATQAEVATLLMRYAALAE
jgi:hypothetical protein